MCACGAHAAADTCPGTGCDPPASALFCVPGVVAQLADLGIDQNVAVTTLVTCNNPVTQAQLRLFPNLVSLDISDAQRLTEFPMWLIDFPHLRTLTMQRVAVPVHRPALVMVRDG